MKQIMNSSVVTNPAVTNPAVSEPAVCMPSIRILKIATCPSLSVRSTLTYHIGCTRQSKVHDIGTPDMQDIPESDPAASEVQLRLFANSAAGFFSNEWVSLDLIQQQFVHGENATSSQLLCALFKGKSANTPAFLFAVLKSEGLVRAVKDAKRLYERVDPSAFMAEIKALMASGVDLKVEEKVANEAKPTAKAVSDTAKPVRPVTPSPILPKSSSKQTGKNAGRKVGTR